MLHSDFYPRSPCGERHDSSYGALDGASISIHALLAESDLIALFDFPIVPVISIHALLAESDSGHPDIRRFDAISIHALLAESDVSSMLYDTTSLIFLSTLSLRRATCCARCHCWGLNEFLSTLSLRRATILHMARLMELLFLSTLSLRRATQNTPCCS